MRNRFNLKAVICKILPACILFTIHFSGYGQHLQALHGSPYAGSLSAEFNPANILNAPYKWDVTVFGFQSKEITNTTRFTNFGFLSIPDTIRYEGTSGLIRRYAHVTNTINILNFRYKWSEDQAVSFGINLRSYIHLQSGPAFWADTITTVTQFLSNNLSTPVYYGNGQSSNWMEYVLGYSRLIKKTDMGRWQGGVQLKIMKSLAGGRGQFNNARLTLDNSGTSPRYLVSGLRGKFMYSANADDLNSSKSNGANIREFVKNSPLNLGLNLGIEYIRYADNFYGENENETAKYDWKFGVSILDLGRNKFHYSGNSLIVNGLKSNVDQYTLDTLLKNINNSSDLSNKLSSIAASVTPLSGDFYINEPTRFVFNLDKYFSHNIYVNAELQANFYSTRNMEHINTRELNLLTITPRWETKTLGAYMPVQYNTEGKFWVGLGVKAGPVILGLDNLGWLLGKKSIPNGGFYFALQIRPGGPKEKDAQPCPK
ncbi:MAG: hypothetical protein JWN76_809 [Chitinophagaceae bacterium]|nr:hypothetical protein [Chitinophagaceae bacterium]